MKHLYLTLTLLFAAPIALAQHSCPQGFIYAGKLSGSGGYGAFDERRELELPEGASLDTSYQQAKVRARDGNSNAKSNLRAEDIPKGIHIAPSGTTSLNKGWAVSKPELKQVDSQYKFGMQLYCTTPGGFSENMGGCEVEVQVCYKPKQ